MSGVEALARALHVGTNCDGCSDYPSERAERYHTTEAQRVLAALSPADRLAIGGITEERLADALHWARNHASDPRGRATPHDHANTYYLAQAREMLAALTEQEPATPVTPEGGEL